MHIINTTASRTLAHTVKSVMLLSLVALASAAPIRRPGGVAGRGGAGHGKPPKKAVTGMNRNSIAARTSSFWSFKTTR